MTHGLAKCDLTSPDKVRYDSWYRFNGSAGVAMPTQCVDIMRCGAEAPGWLYGGHPKAAEGVANRSVCFNWQGKCCYYKTEIQVKNCRGFFVYKFRRPPMMHLRYCGDSTKTGELLAVVTCICTLLYAAGGLQVYMWLPVSRIAQFHFSCYRLKVPVLQCKPASSCYRSIYINSR